jgi:hypothetical protein
LIIGGIALGTVAGGWPLRIAEAKR